MDNSSEGAKRVASDGGTGVGTNNDLDERRRVRVYVICCAITGGTIGVGWGPAGVIGFAVLGALVGDEWARRTT